MQMSLTAEGDRTLQVQGANCIYGGRAREDYFDISFSYSYNTNKIIHYYIGESGIKIAT